MDDDEVFQKVLGDTLETATIRIIAILAGVSVIGGGLAWILNYLIRG